MNDNGIRVNSRSPNLTETTVDIKHISDILACHVVRRIYNKLAII